MVKTVAIKRSKLLSKEECFPEQNDAQKVTCDILCTDASCMASK